MFNVTTKILMFHTFFLSPVHQWNTYTFKNIFHITLVAFTPIGTKCIHVTSNFSSEVVHYKLSIYLKTLSNIVLEISNSLLFQNFGVIYDHKVSARKFTNKTLFKHTDSTIKILSSLEKLRSCKNRSKYIL